MSVRRTGRRRERGQTMVEFAFVVPLLLILIMAIADFGIAFKDWLTVTDAARAGARKGVVYRTYGASRMHTEARNAVKSSSAGGLHPDITDSQIYVNTTASPTIGDDFTVEVHYPFRVRILGKAVYTGQLVGKTTMRVE